MPEYDGFDLLSWYDDRTFAVVFVTAYPDYGIQALRVGAIDYLMKPIIIAELKTAVSRLLEWNADRQTQTIAPAKDKIMLTHTNGFVLADLKDIVRMEADNNYTKVYFADKPALLVSKTLKDFETRLSNTSFVRIHKSDIVNILYVKQYSVEGGGMVIMADGSRLYISRTRMPEFMGVIRKYSISLG
jgi:two-component system LytT family response regulator